MMLLAELLVNLLPSRTDTRARYLWSALVFALIAGCAAYGVGHFYGLPWTRALTWGAVAAGGVVLAYGVVGLGSLRRARARG
ncbi:hypothetical protein AAHZ94_06390 [Streptomyces sp. HSW2009]|uniref:hypothetical protein n=1 Tax=Streptomyces sp. HSW2009 TaxID=3142890 RepID=UPI0032ED9735